MLEQLRKAAKARDKKGGPPGTPPTTPPGKPGEAGKPDDSSKPIQRPTKPETPPDPKELKVRLDKNGRIKLSFTGQPWLGVLQWLADLSNMTLDWQEVPGDYLNIRTQRSYTIREVRDLLNRRLLDRGYTLLCDGEVITIVNIKKLEAAIVPRVEPEELAKRDPYEFVKVSFPLDCITAETAARELEPMKSAQRQAQGDERCQPRRGHGYGGQLPRNVLGIAARTIGGPSAPNRAEIPAALRPRDNVIEELQALVGGETKQSPARRARARRNRSRPW